MSDRIEHEGRILEIDVEVAARRIIEAGGVHLKDLHFRRYVFDTIPAEKDKWIRLRTDGEKTTLALKHIKDDSISGTLEWEVTVSDFDETLHILEQSGHPHRGYQENKRSLYDLDGVEICIDSWPKIPPYLEVEAGSQELVKATIGKLGYDSSEITGMNNDKIYAHYGIDLRTIKSLRF